MSKPRVPIRTSAITMSAFNLQHLHYALAPAASRRPSVCLCAVYCRRVQKPAPCSCTQSSLKIDERGLFGRLASEYPARDRERQADTGAVPGKVSGGSGDAAEAQHRGDHCHREESYCPGSHVVPCAGGSKNARQNTPIGQGISGKAVLTWTAGMYASPARASIRRNKLRQIYMKLIAAPTSRDGR